MVVDAFEQAEQRHQRKNQTAHIDKMFYMSNISVNMSQYIKSVCFFMSYISLYYFLYVFYVNINFIYVSWYFCSNLFEFFHRFEFLSVLKKDQSKSADLNFWLK
jgi:hypothetical protein